MSGETEQLAPCVALALQALALVVAEPDPELRVALADEGHHQIQKAIREQLDREKAAAALEAAVDHVGAGK